MDTSSYIAVQKTFNGRCPHCYGLKHKTYDSPHGEYEHCLSCKKDFYNDHVYYTPQFERMLDDIFNSVYVYVGISKHDDSFVVTLLTFLNFDAPTIYLALFKTWCHIKEIPYKEGK